MFVPWRDELTKQPVLYPTLETNGRKHAYSPAPKPTGDPIYIKKI
jgi:hypothetical protein